ncbi:MAG: NAD-dependent epimerase/dehydratase family protein [Pirellulaceae bacterium]|nr:NAD-dependent epimerase/dehydratase family protein [Planctomycetales bacterium]
MTLPILVTGATGLVGNNVVRRLIELQRPVRVLARSTSAAEPLAGLDVEFATGDVRDFLAVRQAVAGTAAVIHAAALVHVGWSQLEQLRSVNVTGAQNVAAAAAAQGVRMIHVSTVNALALGSRHHPADEQTPLTGKEVPCSYVVSKREAEQQVLRWNAEGGNAVIVNPGFMLGPWDWKPSSGQLIMGIARRFAPLAPWGGCSVCDVRDVADGIVSSIACGVAGERYILAGENITYLQLFRAIARETKSFSPMAPFGPLVRTIVGWSGDLVGRVSGKEPPVNSAALMMSSQFHYYSSDKAQRVLGYRVRSISQSIADSWQWLNARHSRS